MSPFVPRKPTLLRMLNGMENNNANGVGYSTNSESFFQSGQCEEIQEHLRIGISKANQAELQDEIGDLLHAVFSLCVFCRLNPRVTLEQTLTKFERRLRAVKLITEENGFNTLEGEPFDKLMCIWDKAKELVG